jgi:single-strand DNA-binding protein
MNTITITGHLGKPVEVRQTKSGKDVSTLTLAHTPREKVGGEWKDGETMWISVTVWEALPEVVFDKGVKVIVTGSLLQRSYEVNGEKRTQLVINADTVAAVFKHGNPIAGGNKVSSWNDTPTVSTPPEDRTPF